MTIQQIEYIIALDNYKNFVKAAESCFVTQPTLTMQLRKLEDEVGFKLFDREKKPVTPTGFGKQFILKARTILKEVNELKAMVLIESDSMKGEFRLGIIPTLAPYVLPLILPVFSTEYPDTRLIIEELQSDLIINHLKHDLLDIGILATPLYEKSLREIPVFYEPFLAYLNSNNLLMEKTLIKGSELDLENLLLLSEGHCFRNQTLNICNHKSNDEKQQFNYQSGSIETIKALVKKGLGYTLVPELSVMHELSDSPNIKRFESPEPVREVSIVVHNGFTKEMLINNMRKILNKELPERFKKNDRFVRVKWK